MACVKLCCAYTKQSDWLKMFEPPISVGSARGSKLGYDGDDGFFNLRGS